MAQPSLDEELHRLLRWLVRAGTLLEPHDHGGVSASASEVFALGLLRETEELGRQELGQQELGEWMGLEKSTVSRLVAGMQQRGWLERVRDPANRRYSRLRLTTAGSAAATHIGAYVDGHHRQLLDELTPAERDGLRVGLAGLSRVLADHRRAHAQHHQH